MDARMKCGIISMDAHMKCGIISMDAHMKCGIISMDAHMKCGIISMDAHMKCGIISMDACTHEVWDYQHGCTHEVRDLCTHSLARVSFKEGCQCSPSQFPCHWNACQGRVSPKADRKWGKSQKYAHLKSNIN